MAEASLAEVLWLQLGRRDLEVSSWNRDADLGLGVRSRVSI